VLDDSWVASDHAPRVADFSLSNPLSPVPDGTPMRHGARLLPNVPNPFNPSTRLHFEMAVAGEVDLAVYDTRGHLVREFRVGHLAAGHHSVMWDGADQAGRPAASGVYQVQLVTTLGGEVVRDVRPVVLVE
jgi:hypothetical protein